MSPNLLHAVDREWQSHLLRHAESLCCTGNGHTGTVCVVLCASILPQLGSLGRIWSRHCCLQGSGWNKLGGGGGEEQWRGLGGTVGREAVRGRD